jgi:ubiquinone/menaquinone biosynthesis C-methylase UbiE
MSIIETLQLGRAARVEAMETAMGSLQGRRILDIGCGEGQVARALAAKGATVQGYDPFIKPGDWIDEGPGRFRLSNGQADAIPEPDASADAVLFCLSLHHVPQASMGAALAEARRLLKPGGYLCVIEPLAEGPAQYLSELFHDETVVRRNALNALNAHAAPAFPSERVVYFSEERHFPSFDAFTGQAIRNMRFNGYTEAAVLNPKVRERFEETLGQGGRFDQYFRMNLFA